MRPFTNVLLLLLLIYGTLNAQQTKQYSFLHFTTANGLASNIVNSMAQDEEGFMWFATTNGLQRYDGYKFETFRSVKGNASTIPLDNLASIYYDRKFNLWIVTANNKVGYFNTRTFQFTEVPLNRPVKKPYTPTSFFETPNGELVMQEFMGDVFVYNEPKGQLLVNNQVLPTPKGWHRSKAVWDAAINKYWIGTDSGLVLYNPATQKLSYRNHNVEQDPVIRQFQNEVVVLNVFADRQQNVSFYNWPPTNSHPFLLNYNRSTGEAIKQNLSDKLSIGYHEIAGFLQQRSGRVWIFGRPFLAEWLPDRKNFLPVPNEYRNEQSIKFGLVTSWFEDGERNIWVGTDNGLFLFNPDAQRFETYNPVRPTGKAVLEAPVQAILPAAEGNIFVGCRGVGLYNYDNNFNPIPLPKNLQNEQNTLSIWDMHQHTKSGKIWIALQSGGIVVYDPKTGIVIKDFPAAFEKRTIRQLTEDRDGNLWFGTHGGKIVKWDFEQSGDNPRTGYATVLKTGLVHKMALDNKGFLWIATLGQGLLQMDPSNNKVVHTITAQQPAGKALINNSPTDILPYNDSTLIVISNGVNLVNLNTFNVTHITTAEGLPSNTAFCVQKDNQGILWLGMTNGLCRMNLQKNIFILFDRRDGLVYDNFNVAGAHAINDGKLCFTTDRNFLVFNPESFLQANKIPPDPDFTSIKLANKYLLVDSLERAGKIVLSYNNNALTFEFSVLSFLKQNQPNYYYIMENLDKDWKKTDELNQAVYNYLPPGDYVFKVKSINQDGIMSNSYASIKVEVTPPFWKTWWFYALIVLAIIALLYIIDKERITRLRALQSVRAQIAGNLHEEINVTLNDINLLSEIAKIKADRDLDRSKDYIDQISVKSRSMIESMDDMLWSIEPGNDSMEKLILRLNEFTDGFRKTYDVDIELTIDKNIYGLMLDMKYRHEFLHFYKEALKYIIQHSVCSTIYISLEYNKSKLSLKLLAQCNQLQHEDVVSLQTKNEMQKRAEQLNGMLDMTVDKKSIAIILQMAV